MAHTDNTENNNNTGQTENHSNNCQTGSNNSLFELISPRSGPILAALIADILANGLDSNRIASMGAFVTIIGDSLSFISAQMELQETLGSSDVCTR